EEQPLPAAASPTTQSPDYVPESDPEADPEEDDDEDPKEDPVDYPADGGNDGDDEDEPSVDDEDKEVVIEADDEEEEEEHPAPADSTDVALPVIDHALSAEETEPFGIDKSAATPPPHPAYRVTARISIPAPVPTPVWSDAEVARLLAISTPLSSPLSPWSSPLPQIPSPLLPSILSPLPVSPPLPQISSPPLLVSSPMPVLSLSPPASPIRLLGYRATMIRWRAETASTSHSIPLPPPIILSYTKPDAPSLGTPPLHLLSTDHRADRLEVTLPPQKRLAGGLRTDYDFVATMDREIMRDLERDVGYGITDSWDEIVEAMHGTPVVTDVAEFSQRTGRPAFGMVAYHVGLGIGVHIARSARLIKTEARISPEKLGGDEPWTCLLSITGIIFSYDLKKMAPKRRTTRLNPETTSAATAATTTTVTNAQLQALIDQGVIAVLAARDANMKGFDSHNSGTGARRNERATRECTYPYFIKCQPLN
ncbi:hypothetical protein Tco_1454181, partial [Tanacetum coccineum]